MIRSTPGIAVRSNSLLDVLPLHEREDPPCRVNFRFTRKQLCTILQELETQKNYQTILRREWDSEVEVWCRFTTENSRLMRLIGAYMTYLYDRALDHFVYDHPGKYLEWYVGRMKGVDDIIMQLKQILYDNHVCTQNC